MGNWGTPWKHDGEHIGKTGQKTKNPSPAAKRKKLDTS
jgi:hypothetical protein